MDLSPVNILLSLGAGFLSIASPCVLPVIPVIVAGTDHDNRFRPLFIVAGLSLTFIVMGIASSAFASLLGGKMYYLEKVTGSLIVIFGLAMVVDRNPFEKITFFNRFSRRQSTGNLAAFGLGASLGLVWIPCIGPMLSGILAMVASTGTFAGGLVLLVFYSLGFSIPVLLAGYFSQFFRSRLGRLKSHGRLVHVVSGLVLVLLGAFILTKGMIGFSL